MRGRDGRAMIYTRRVILCYGLRMARGSTPNRVNVTLDDVYAEKLRRLAERTHVNEGTLARSLLSTALDEADPDARTVAELLDGIPGAFERAQLGLGQARAGLGVPLEEM
jgi:hypothetical protein